MSRALHSTRASRREVRTAGQSLVEFALVTPVLLLLIVGLADLARAWMSYQVITDVARQGARSLVVDDPTIDADSVRAIIDNGLTRAGLDPSTATVTLTGAGTGRGSPASVQIALPYRFNWLGPMLSWANGTDSITLITNFVMRNE